jgi:hypothetical protein
VTLCPLVGEAEIINLTGINALDLVEVSTRN